MIGGLRSVEPIGFPIVPYTMIWVRSEATASSSGRAAGSRERVHLKHESKLAARVEGRSSLARLGLMVHLTAPTIHPGFSGRITLEMINHGPFYLRLVPGTTRVCQLIFERLEDAPEGEIATGFQGRDLASGGTSSKG